MEKKRKNKSVAVCKEISIKDEKTMYYEIDESMKKTFIPDSYLFREETTEKGTIMSAIYVDKIIPGVKSREGSVKVNKNISFRKIDDEFIFQMEEESVQEYKNADLKGFKKLLKETLSDLNLVISQCRNFYTDERRKYLIDTYFSNPKEFEKHSSRDKYMWIKEINGGELDLYNEMNIRELKVMVESFVEENRIITSRDKDALLKYCVEELDNVFCAIEPKRKARMLMDDYIGIRVDSKKKDLIWELRSDYTIRIGFSFFWGMVKNVLSLTYVPAILLLLDNEYKIPIYAMLSVVYLIALVFSDEKQMDKLLSGVNNGVEARYVTLYYQGVIVSLIFILFSIEMIVAPSTDMQMLIKYLLMNIVIAYAIIIVFNMVVTLLRWSVIMFSATRVYRKIWKNNKGVLGKVVITIIYILGLFACGDILGGSESTLTWKFWVLAMSYMAVIMRIIALWRDVLLKEC